MSSPAPVARRRSRSGTLARLALFGPPVAALIAAEDRLPGLWPLRFPRSPNDLERDPRRLFTLLTTPSYGLIAPLGDRATVRFVSQARADLLAHEPDKNRMTAGFDVTYEQQGTARTARVFAKFQSSRGMPLYMQAVRAVAEHGLAREIEFYRRLAPVVPVAVPRPIFADAVTMLNRVCLVTERVDGTPAADWRGGSLPAMRALLASAARLNAFFLDRLDEPSVSWIPARRGLEFAEWVATFLGRHEPWYRRIWSALQAWFDDAPVTLVHGDCRPGNMIFRGIEPHAGDAGDEGAASWPDGATPDSAAVIMCDWQAVNVAPLPWDFAYATTVGLRVADRRAWQTRLLDEYLDHLKTNRVPPAHLDRGRIILQVQLLAIVLACISLAVLDNGLWSGQGNVKEDGAAWLRRVLEAGADGDTAAIAAALAVSAADIRRLQEYFRERRRSVVPVEDEPAERAQANLEL